MIQKTDDFPFALIPAPLLAWYRENKRVLPWRENPTPYRVWVSEIMLQQTRVEAAREYYLRFLKELPTVQDLAAWAGILQSRAQYAEGGDRPLQAFRRGISRR